MKRNRHTLLLIFMLFACLSSLPAQDKPVPPPRPFKPELNEARKSLPSIDLPQYVIMGTDVISFTDTRKEPIELHHPEEFSARAGRGKREAYFGDLASITPPLQLQTIPGVRNLLLIRAGYGLFQTPYAEGWYGDHFVYGDITSHAVYEKSNGHVPRAGFERWGFDLSGGSFLPLHFPAILSKSRIQGEMHIHSLDHKLYANMVEPAVPQLYFERSKTEISYAGDILSRKNSIIDYTVRLYADHTLLKEKLSIRDSLERDKYLFYENNYGIEATVIYPVGQFPIQTALFLTFSDNTPTGLKGHNPCYTRLSAKSNYWVLKDLQLDFGMSLYMFRGSDDDTQGRLCPNLHVKYYLDNEIHAFAEYRSEVNRISIRDLINMNPYLMLGSDLRHSDVPLNILLGAAYDDRKSISGRIYFEYIYANKYPIFSRVPTPVPQQWYMQYLGASVTSLNADVSFEITESDHVLGNLAVRTSKMNDRETRIPYLPDFEVKGIYRHEFPFKLDVTGTIQLIENRASDNGSLPSFITFDVEGEYHVTNNFGVYLSFRNMLDAKYQIWQGYSEKPFFLNAGVTVRF